MPFHGEDISVCLAGSFAGRAKKKQKPATPNIPRKSLIHVFTRPNHVQLLRLAKIECIHGSMAIDTIWLCIYRALLLFTFLPLLQKNGTSIFPFEAIPELTFVQTSLLSNTQTLGLPSSCPTQCTTSRTCWPHGPSSHAGLHIQTRHTWLIMSVRIVFKSVSQQ